MTLFNIAAAVIPRGATRTYRVPVLGCELDLAPMSETNKPFWSEYITLVSGLVAAGGDGPANEDTAARNRRRDAPLMAKHVIKGWRGLTLADGSPAPFSVQAAADFLNELANTEGAEHIFDGIRAFAKDPDNFTGHALGAAQALAGNSSGG